MQAFCTKCKEVCDLHGESLITLTNGNKISKGYCSKCGEIVFSTGTIIFLKERITKQSITNDNLAKLRSQYQSSSQRTGYWFSVACFIFIICVIGYLIKNRAIYLAIILSAILLVLYLLNKAKNKSVKLSADEIELNVRESHCLMAECPYCNQLVQAPIPHYEGIHLVHPQGFYCPACDQRILILDDAFAKVPQKH